MKKLILALCLISTSAFAQTADPKLLENMYKECVTQRNNTAMLSDFHAASWSTSKSRIEELESKIRGLEEKLKEFEK